MPNLPALPDFPGKGIVTQTGRRVRLVAAGAGLAAVAAGGVLARKALRRGGGDDERPSADPIAETPSAPPGAEAEAPVVKPKPLKADKPAAKPKPPKAKPKPKADATAKAPVKPPKADAKPPKADAKPPLTTGTDAPPKPEVEPGNISGHAEPHHALNNPVGDPDETEYPDPFEKRDDPRDPADPDGEPFGEEPHPQTGAASTSEPPPSQDPEAGDRATPPKRDKLDD